MNKLDKSAIYNRRLLYSGFILLLFATLIYGFVSLQVGKKEIYLQKSINNSIRELQIYPVRGLIRDCQNRILVDNRPSFSVAVIQKVVNKECINYLSGLLNIEKKGIKEKIHKQYGFRPVIIARDISQEQIIALEENRLDLLGVHTLVEAKRYYPEKVVSPHIFGTIGEVSRAEQLLNPNYMQCR